MRKGLLWTLIAPALISLSSLTASTATHEPGVEHRSYARTTNAAAQPQGREFRKTVALEPGGDLTLRTDKGSVRLSAWDQPQVEIYARIEPPDNAEEDYARRAVEAARIDVIEGGRSLSVRSNFSDVPSHSFPWGDSRSLPQIHYEIRAPRKLNLDVNADRCRVELQGVAGRILVDTDRTPVKLSDLAGEITLRMDRGEATLSGLAGSLNIQTDRTNTRAYGVRIEGDSRLNVGRGEFELRVPASQGLNLSASLGRREHLYTDFGITMRTFGKENIEGTINGGGPRLVIEADRSVIRLKRD